MCGDNASPLAKDGSAFFKVGRTEWFELKPSKRLEYLAFGWILQVFSTA